MMNPPNWVDVVLGVVGCLGFVLAVILAIMEYQRYKLPLYLKIQCYKVEYFGNQESVVLFRLCLVNSASAGKTVDKVKYAQKMRLSNDKHSKIIGITWREPLAKHDINHRTVIYELPNTGRLMPYDEILQPPLDIPPHQSRVRWYYLIARIEESIEQYPMTFQLFDIFGNKLAEDRIYISTANLKTVGMYYPPESS